LLKDGEVNGILEEIVWVDWGFTCCSFFFVCFMFKSFICSSSSFNHFFTYYCNLINFVESIWSDL